MRVESFPQRPYAVPAGATELILVRHGASQAAVEGEPFPLVDGRSDPALAPEGRAQAEAVGARLAEEDFARLFVSGLTRTRETAAPLAARRQMAPELVPDLVEVGLGEWEGGEYRIRMRRRDPLAVRVHREERYDLIPGAEPAEAFAARVDRGVRRVVGETGPDAAAVVVVHGGVIGEICRQATGSRPFAFIRADNGSLTRVVVRKDGSRLVRSFNDTAHLD